MALRRTGTEQQKRCIASITIGDLKTQLTTEWCEPRDFNPSSNWGVMASLRARVVKLVQEHAQRWGACEAQVDYLEETRTEIVQTYVSVRATRQTSNTVVGEQA